MVRNLPRLLKSIRDKNESIALVVEGGGLRGVVSAAMLSIFEDFDLFSQIKALSGTSSGALNGAYFLNRDTSSVLQLYEKMASKDFIQPFQWPDAMNLSFLFDQQIAHVHPLNLETLLAHPTNFLITVTNILAGRSEFHRAQDCTSEAELLSTLKASTSAPLFSTNHENLKGQPYNDGHIGLAIPVDCFEDSHFDHIFCLLTRQNGYVKRTNLLSSLFNNFALKKYNSSFKENFKKAGTAYARQLERIHSSTKITALQLEKEDFLVSKMCRNPADIQKCVEVVRHRFLREA